MSRRIIVIGAGAAGMMAAGQAAALGAQVLLLERNSRPGRKLMITGKGRCNVTNACTLLNELMDFIPTNGRFLYSAFSRMMPYDVIDFFETAGVSMKIERGNRVFPESDKAVDVVDALDKFCKQNGVKRHEERVVALLQEDGFVAGVKCESGNTYQADAVVVATGGMSYPLTGSTGDGYTLAKQAGHNIVDPKPSLVPLETQENWVKEAQGLALKNVRLTVFDAEKYNEVYTDFGEMLFTHFGVSGPIVLSASAHLSDIKKDRYQLLIDLKPALSHEQLDARILRDFAEMPNKALANALAKLLPKSLIPIIVRLSEIPSDLRVNQITRDDRQALGALIKSLPLTVTGKRPIEEAIVTTGGVNVAQVNPKTMESKLLNGLYFAGEVLDVDAYTGGFNLQIAFATGNLAGTSAASE
ncbi:MAG: NAD(P)/FAD-dependent oxidoreductase [Ruminococcaceae bacterium]|nr:NAD(P)/FAD-dependent oxidoreductase [Oscillospiraceae bacterium]